MFESFLKIDGIPGESTDAAHKDWIDVTGWDYASDLGNQGAQVAARPNLRDLLVAKRLDRASPLLFRALNNSQRFATVELEAVDSDDRRRFIRVILKNAVITNARLHAGPDTEQRPTESLAFGYASIEWIYTLPPNPDGTPGADVSALLSRR
ncbi:MAG: type VI secretion system tube protein Hcp [Acidobacteria bacterium]|nr:type VI secretion system tube protein Hcp [Acidobacteriota bacterium]